MDNTVASYIDLYKLKNIKEGTIYQTSNNNKYYIKQGHTWEELKQGIQGTGPSFSIYDLNKQAVMQLPPLTTEQIKEKTEEWNRWAISKNDSHYMLLCNQLKYYTLFAETDNAFFGSFGAAIATLLIEDFYIIYSIDPTEDGAYEIWAKLNNEQQEPEAFYLFPYEAGVIYYE